MAVNVIALSGETLPPERLEGTPPPLRDLLALASWLAVRWSDIDDEARVTLARRIQQVASDLGRQANGNGHDHGTRDDPRMVNRLLMLTPREIEVLQAVADGHSTSKIASILGISTATVRSHVKSLLAKLGLHSRVEAVSLILKSNGRSPAGQLP
jgi:DNA-binding CsgD family transcriptional regulator